VRGERLNDGLSAAFYTTALAGGFRRMVHLIHRPVRPPAGMTIADLAGWHATALRARFAEPVDVMGTSGGGITALQLALDHPATVRRLVLCVTASRGDEDQLVPPDLVRATAAGIPDARLVLLPGRGHASALFDRRTKPVIAAFLAEPPR
jgi:pimeloyl-ACP methyl ester carboxylesterase